MTTAETLPHSQYLDLIDRYGRAALDALGGLRPDTKVPPHDSKALVHARDHLETLEIWAWLLEHPDSDWQAYEAPPSVARYDDVLAAIGRARDRVIRLLVDAGPELELDYFDRPGSSYDVARLLAHESISIASSAGEANGTQAPPLHPAVAADCVDRALAHWSEPDAKVVWHPAPAQLVAADTGRSWWVRFGGDEAELHGAIAPGPSGPAALVLTDGSEALLRWLEGYTGPAPKVEGDVTTLRTLRIALGHRVEPAPRRLWWRRR